MPGKFIKTIKVAMAREDLSQKELAFKLGISEPELCRKFNGERAWMNEELGKLLEILGLIILPTRKFTDLMLKMLDEGEEEPG